MMATTATTFAVAPCLSSLSLLLLLRDNHCRFHCLDDNNNVVIPCGISPLQSIPGNICGDGDNNGRRRGLDLFCNSSENTFGNVGRIVGGVQDNEDYGYYNDCLEDGVNKTSY